jgi:hypothetical protein
MHQDEHNRFADYLLDTGLSQYRGVEPRPGLENRILARLRTEQAAALWRERAWRTGAGLIAAGVVLALASTAFRSRLHVPIPATGSQGPGPMVEGSRNTGAVLPRRSFMPGHRNPGQVEHSAELRGSADSVSNSVARFRKPGTAEVVRRRARTEEPRPVVFPSPAPLSEQENLLVSLVRQSPERAWAAFPEESEAMASVRVPDLDIPSLEMKDLSSDAMDRTR